MMIRLLVGAVAGLVTAGAFAGEKATFEVPQAAVAPVADGTIGADEWAGALRLVGAGRPVDARRAELLMKWDAGNLYLAMRSVTAPCGKLNFTPGGQPAMNDSIELWLDPPKAKRMVEQKKFGYFQLITSWTGEPYLCHHDPGYGLPATKWKADGLKVASEIHGDEWHIELVIPAADLGLKTLAGVELPLLAVRNFRIGGGGQKPFGPGPAGFMDAGSYARFRMVASKSGKTYDWYSEQKPAPFEWKTPEAAIVASGKDLVFSAGGCQTVKGTKIPVPGTILLKAKTDKPLAKGWRRYFSSKYRSSGYFGFQEDANNWRTMLFFAHGFKDKPVVNSRLKCPSAGRESVVAVTFEPHKVTYYLNGVKQGETDLPAELVPEKLGDLTLGGGEPGLVIPEWTLYSRLLTPAEVKELSLGETPVSGTVAWYQELRALALGLTCDPARVPGGELALSVRKVGTTESVFRATVPLAKGVKTKGAKALVVLHEVVPAKELADGDYIAAVSVAGAEDDALVEKPFHVQTYEWLGNKIGTADRVVTGFTPVAAKGRTLSCVLRDYQLGADGLPEQIVADGEPILARPVALRAEKDGKAYRLAGGETAFEAKKLSDTAIEYAAEGKYKTVRARFEQDGLLKFDLVLPRTPKADRVWLEIPVKKEYATLFHACGEGLRANPAGAVPAGDGVVFKSRDIPQTHLSNFIPYCWVGTDTRGVCYAADWDRDWAHGKDRDAVEVVREMDGTVTIVLNLLNAPYDASRPRTITLGLMASPVKPQPKGWRGWSDGFNYNGTLNARCLYSPPYWGGHCSWAQRYPAWGEMEYLRKLAEATRTGKPDKAYMNDFVNRVVGSKDKHDKETNWQWSKTKEKSREYVMRHTQCGFGTAAGLHGKANPLLYPYTCDADGSQMLAENAAFGDSWGGNCSVAVRSYADYAMWHFDRMLETGAFQGIYDDNTFVKLNVNWATGDAWVDEQGEVHPSCGVWAGREFRRRQAVALMDRGLLPWVTMHHTNANILPKLSFGINTMGMEWKYGKSDFQTRYTPEYIRAVCQGKQLGVYPTIIDGITGVSAKNRPEQIHATRTLLATALVHDLRPTLPHSSDFGLVCRTIQALIDWGIAADDCEAFLYWDKASPLVSSDKDVFVTTYRRGKKMLAVVASWKGEEAKVVLSAKRGRFASARDLESGKTLSVSAGNLSQTVPAHEFVILELEASK